MKHIFSFFRRRRSLPERAVQLSSLRQYRYGAFPSMEQEWYRYESRSGLYRYLRNRVPIISSAIWHWVRLCNTPGSYHLSGRDSHRREAEGALDALLQRICTVVGVKRNGLGSLLELFFQEVFTNGTFSGRLVPLASGSGIDYFLDMDSSDIEWTRRGRWIPRLKQGDGSAALDPHLFFHYGLGADRFHPGGVSFLASVEFVAVIEQRMVEDMARSAHNAGSPHLHIKVKPPDRFEHESEAQYLERSEKYFDNTVALFKEIDPDDNIFSWSDLEVTIVGGERVMPYSWRLNREQVIEDVVTGMKLYPWVVGRSHGTTKNWVQGQFNLLMQVVDSIQEEGKALAEWILNTELALRGIPVRAAYVFSPNQDPYQLERERSAALRFETVDRKVRRGYISKKEGAHELGYHDVYLKD